MTPPCIWTFLSSLTKSGFFSILLARIIRERSSRTMRATVIIVEESKGKHQPMRLGAFLHSATGGRVVTLTTSDGMGGAAVLAPGVTLTANVVDLLEAGAGKAEKGEGEAEEKPAARPTDKPAEKAAEKPAPHPNVRDPLREAHAPRPVKQLVTFGQIDVHGGELRELPWDT